MEIFSALTLIFLICELIILFYGITLFYDKTNIIRNYLINIYNSFYLQLKIYKCLFLECILHGLGIIFYSWFSLERWHYSILRTLWGVFR